MLKKSKFTTAMCFISGLMGAQAHADYRIIPVPTDDPRVTPEFAALGDMYEAGGLIWSGAPSRNMEWDEARDLCERLGNDSKLPTKSNYTSLVWSMGYATPGGYDPTVIPGMSERTFWTLDGITLKTIFFGDTGKLDTIDLSSYKYRNLHYWVRCVIPVKNELPESQL